MKQIIIKDFQFGNSIRHGWSLVMHEQESVCVESVSIQEGFQNASLNTLTPKVFRQQFMFMQHF